MMWFETLNSTVHLVYLVDQKSFFLFTLFFSRFRRPCVVTFIVLLLPGNACVRAVLRPIAYAGRHERHCNAHYCRWAFFPVVYTI